MRETTKTITFPDFVFQYARGGNFDEANAITVCEPSFEQRKVHNRMSAVVVEAQTVAWQKYLAMTQKQNGGAEAAPSSKAETDDASDGGTDEDAAEPDMIAICRAGMSTDAYVSFLDYVLGQLKDNKYLAFIGSDTSLPLKERIPVGDLVWTNIAAAGGVDAVNQVLGAFMSFFSINAAARKSSGTQRS